MNYLDLKSAVAILQLVAGSKGQLTWYNIVRTVDQLGVERIPPPYAVLKGLARLGYLTTSPLEGGNAATYQITPQGQAFLTEREVRLTASGALPSTT
jgi:DNA-binding PadR family transcriptional regulator